MAFTLPNLPYDKKALEPHMSEKTLTFHHEKHHQAYVTNLNNFIKGTPLEEKTLEEIIHVSFNDPQKVSIFNNAAQVWNHTFFWQSMKPNGGKYVPEVLMKKIIEDFGSFETLKEEFSKAATTQFGSGWAWLILENNKLKVIKTGNADLPFVHGATALLTCDVWEHAYYLDFQNRRPDYVKTFLDHLANWDFAAQNLEKA